MKFLLTILLFNLIIFSQEDSTDQQRVQRFEQIIISADEVLEVKGGEKRKAYGVPSLITADLDSLNSLEKQQSLLLPPAGLPRSILSQANDMAYVKSSLGRFTTIDADAGYSFSYKDFDIYSKANLEVSSGHLEGANYSDFGFELISDYNADPKFWIFGGSKTRTRFNYQNQNYNTFAVFDPENRTADSIALFVDVDGSYNGFLFKTGAGFDLLNLKGDLNDFTDTGISGFLQIVNPYNKYRFGVDANAEIRSGNSQSNNYFETVGFIKYISKNFDLNLKGGVQLAQNDSNTIFMPNLKASMDFKTGKLFSLNINAGTGLIRNTFANLYRANPYLSWNSFLDHTREQLYIGSNFKFHGKRNYAVNAGVKYSLLKNNLNWVQSDSASFEIQYVDGSIIKTYLESFYDIDSKQTLTARIEFNLLSSDFDAGFTYVPAVEIFTDYRLRFIDNLVLLIGLDYVGTRFADLNGDIEIDPFINLRFNADYSINKNLALFIKSENILNQDIYSFQHYRQRDLFASVGFLWKF